MITELELASISSGDFERNRERVRDESGREDTDMVRVASLKLREQERL